VLNREAFGIGQLVAGGEVDELRAMDHLAAAARATGLGDGEIRRTLASGFNAGSRRPRNAPGTESRAEAVSLEVDKKGAPKKHVTNVLTVFESDPRWRGVIGYDAFREGPILLRQPPQRPLDAIERVGAEWSAQDSTRAAAWLSIEYGLEVPSERITEAVLATAQRHAVHPVRNYLASLTWDGHGRVDTFFSSYCGTPDSPYARGVARILFLSAVARIRSPGAKVDTIPILEGEQGAHKSSVLAVLGGEWFADTPIPLGDKDAYQVLRGVWIYELAELAAFKGRDATRIKSFASGKDDHYRPSYEPRVRCAPRQCIFVGTTNEAHYLVDATGARRFWPVTVQRIDLDAVRRDRDQLWAEACARLAQGENWWATHDFEALGASEQENRFEGDPWEAPLEKWLAYPVSVRIDAQDRRHEEPLDPTEGFTMAEILAHGLSLATERQGKADQTRAAAILRRLGWERETNPHHVNGARVRRWRRMRAAPVRQQLPSSVPSAGAR
jgi:putative DNA primase/helicase